MPTSSAVANGGGYVALPYGVRAFYSKEIFWLAQPRLRFLQFAKIRRDLQAAGGGNQIIFTKYANLDGGGEIEENETVVPDSMSNSQVVINIKENVKAVQVTELLLKTSMLNTMADASQMLANNFAMVLDAQLMRAALSTTNVVFGGQAASAATMSATTSILSAKTARDCVEILATNMAPKINGEFYVAFVHPHVVRQLREDPEWVAAHVYMGRRQLYLGEVGMFDGVVYIETTVMPKFNNAQVVAKYGGSYTPTVGYESVFFGENAIAWGIAMDVELRDDGVIDFGRKHSLAWYGIWGTGLLENSYAVRLLTI